MAEGLQFKDLLMDKSLLNNCRMCFKVKKNSIKIFDGWNNNGSKIYAVTGIEIIESSQVPALICPDCLTSLNSAYYLRTQCRETNEKFRKILFEKFEKENWSKNLKSLREDGNVEEEVNLVDIKCKVEIEEAIDEIQHFDDDFATFDEPEPEPKVTIKKEKPKKSSKPKDPSKIKPKLPPKCELCHKVFCSTRNLNRHVKNIHKSLLESWKPQKLQHLSLEYFCDICGKPFPNRAKISMHMRCHAQKYLRELRPHGPCTTCGTFFKTKDALNKHEFSHRRTAEDYWYCDLCGHRFRVRSLLFTHIKTRHVEKIRFYCPDCPGKSFGTKYSLKTHVDFKHLNIRKHVCNVCGQGFPKNSKLVKHFRIHTGEKAFQCKICDKRFTHDSDFIRHKWAHEGKRKYTCQICRRSYDSKVELDGHKCPWL